MWSDNETTRDFLNFEALATTVTGIIANTKGEPVSIGVSGSWGVGKSSLIKLIREKSESSDQNFIFVQFNAWLYQGYDDAKASLLEVVAIELEQYALKNKTPLDSITEVLSRINWLRLATVGVGLTAALNTGIPLGGIAAKLLGDQDRSTNQVVSEFDSEKITDSVKKTVDSGKGLIKRAKTKSPPKEIETIRKGFENALKQLDVTLVVLIDDLDRCLPQTAISTLEAIRLLLFLKNTAFVIAADTAIIKHAVSKHFEGMEEKIAASYFDKLIQIPVAVPKLSLPDIKAYMSLLYIENSDIDKNLKEEIRKTICDSLKRTWDNQKFDAFDIVKRIKELGIEVTSRLREQLQTVERLAPMMTADTAIEANPRLIKRFMNAISFQRDIGKILDIDLDERILAKFLLLERCGSASFFNAIKESISEHPKGFSKVIGDIELQLQQGKKSEDQEIYKDAFLQKWVASEPSLKEVDLRPYMYISREHAPLLASGERISTKALEAV